MAVPPEFTRGVSQGHDFTRLTFRVNAELSKGEQVRTHTHAFALVRAHDIDDAHAIFKNSCSSWEAATLLEDSIQIVQ